MAESSEYAAIEAATEIVERGLHHSPEKKKESFKVLAQASKQGIDTRSRLAEASTLTAICQTVEIEEDQEVLDYALRCIANACADNDAARAIVTEHGFTWIKQCSINANERNKALLPQVLYNICCDYEPAQRRCCKEGVHLAICSKFETPATGDSGPHLEDYSTLIEVLFSIAATDAPLDEAITKAQTVALLDYPHYTCRDADAVDYATALETVLIYLRKPDFQEGIIGSGVFEYVWIIMSELTVRIDCCLEQNGSDHDDFKLLAPLGTSLTWCISDIAAMDHFADTYRWSDGPGQYCHHVPQRVLDETRMNPEVYRPGLMMLFVAACQVLGNFLMVKQPEEVTSIVSSWRSHSDIFTIIVELQERNRSSDVLHAAAGLMAHMTRCDSSQHNFAREENCLPALRIYCEHPMKEVKADGMRLLRTLSAHSSAHREQLRDLMLEYFVKEPESSAEAEHQTHSPPDAPS